MMVGMSAPSSFRIVSAVCRLPSYRRRSSMLASTSSSLNSSLVALVRGAVRRARLEAVQARPACVRGRAAVPPSEALKLPLQAEQLRFQVDVRPARPDVSPCRNPIPTPMIHRMQEGRFEERRGTPWPASDRLLAGGGSGTVPRRYGDRVVPAPPWSSTVRTGCRCGGRPTARCPRRAGRPGPRPGGCDGEGAARGSAPTPCWRGASRPKPAAPCVPTSARTSSRNGTPSGTYPRRAPARPPESGPTSAGSAPRPPTRTLGPPRPTPLSSATPPNHDPPQARSAPVAIRPGHDLAERDPTQARSDRAPGVWP